MAAPTPVASASSGDSKFSHVNQHSAPCFGDLDEAGNTKINEAVILAVAESIALIMDQHLLQQPLAEPTVPFEEVSALLQLRGITLGIR